MSNQQNSDIANGSTTSIQSGLRRYFLLTGVWASFFLSGGCGLLYQVVWTRKLVLLFGITSYAVSTILFIFFLGLGIGSFWGGRQAERTRRPLFLYGLYQVIIGVWALLFILLVDAGEGAIATILRIAAASPAAGVLLRMVLALTFLIVPVTLMGATLPLLARFTASAGRRAGFHVGLLYAINTLGAVAGCTLAGFILIERLGYTGTTWVGALVSVLIGLASMMLDPRRSSRSVITTGLIETADALHVSPSRMALSLILTTFAIAGFCGLALEVLWMRLLTIVFTGTTYAYTTMLASLLCGIVAGSVIASVLADRFRARQAWFGAAEALAGLACISTLVAFARVPGWFEQMSLDAGYEWSKLVWVKFRVSFLVLFAPMFFSGMAFPFAVKAFSDLQGRIGRDVGVLYGVNTVGGVLGSLAGGYLLIPLTGTHRGIFLLGMLLFVFGTVTLLHALRRSLPKLVLAIMLCLVALGWAWRAHSGDVGRVLTIADMPEDNQMVHFREGVEGTVAVSDEPDWTGHTNRVLWINGVQATASIEKGVRMNRFQGTLPLLFDRSPREVLLMCFGSGITAGTLAQSDFERLDAVEIARDVLDAADYFAEDNLHVLDHPNVQFIVDDGRNYLLTTDRRYDFITFEPMPLALSGVSTFYTREYYELCLSRLNPGGMVSQWVPLHSLNPEVVKSLTRTFIQVFPEHCAWFINADLFLVGSDQPLLIDFQAASERLARPGLHEALAAVELDDPIDLIASFVMDKDALARFTGDGRIMRDDRPWAEFEAPKLMYERTVQDSLRELKNCMTSPVSMLRRDGVDPASLNAVTVSLERRFASRQAGLDAVIEYYGGMFGDTPERSFISALRIDPGDRMAAFYLRQIARSRMEMFIRWEQYAEAEQVLSEMMEVLPDTPLFHALLGDVRRAAGDLDAAREQYLRAIELGGTEPMLKNRLRELDESATAANSAGAS